MSRQNMSLLIDQHHHLQKLVGLFCHGHQFEVLLLMCNSSENKLGEELKEVVSIDVKQIAKCFSGRLEKHPKHAVKCAIKHAINLTIREFQSLHQNQRDKFQDFQKWMKEHSNIV